MTKDELQYLINQIVLSERPSEMGILITKDGIIYFSNNYTLEIAKKMFERVERNIVEGLQKNHEVKGN